MLFLQEADEHCSCDRVCKVMDYGHGLWAANAFGVGRRNIVFSYKGSSTEWQKMPIAAYSDFSFESQYRGRDDVYIGAEDGSTTEGCNPRSCTRVVKNSDLTRYSS